MREKRYRTFSSYLKERFGAPVRKITIDGGFTCPNRDGSKGTGGCTYCSEGSTPLPQSVRLMDVAAQTARGIENVKHKFGTRKVIAYFQSYSNTYGPVDRLRAIYDMALSFPEVEGISIGTRPDCFDADIAKLIGGYSASLMDVWVEFGLQTIHDATLERINRGHKADIVPQAISLARAEGISVCLHVILGLPGETEDMMRETMRFVSSMPIQAVKIHGLHVISGTSLEQEYLAGKLRLMERTDYVRLAADFIELIPPDVVIQRLVGDAPPSKLIAPDWCSKKESVIADIDAELERRDSRQGNMYNREPAAPAAN